MPDLTVVTWNVHGTAGRVDALVADLRAGRLTDGVRPRHVVLMLQEAAADTRVEGFDVFFAPATSGRAVVRGNAILSSAPMAAPRAIELPRGRQRRVAAVATARIVGVDWLLVNVHLENRAPWWKGALPGDTIRGRQMDALLAQLPADVPGILGGDLNIWLGTRERAYRVALEAFPEPRDAQPPLTFRERLTLDHVMLRLPQGWRASRARVADRYGSDHHPVVASLFATRAF